MVSKGNHPQMAEQFRLVKYDHLPRYSMLMEVQEKEQHCMVSFPDPCFAILQFKKRNFRL